MATSPAVFAQDVGCTTCHRDYTAGSIHAALNQACVSCHGEGTEHVARPTAGGVIGFKEEPAKTRTAACAACHSDAHPRGISAHDSAGLACNDCHTIHDDRSRASDESLPAGFERIDAGSQACIGCHEEIFSDFGFSERHRLQENVLTCASCHDPHDPSVQARLGGARQDLFAVAYRGDNTVVDGRITYRATDSIAIGGSLRIYDNDGSFPHSRITNNFGAIT